MQNKYLSFSITIYCLFIGLTALADESGKNNIESQNIINSDLPNDSQRKFDYYFHEAVNAKVTEKYDVAFDFFNYCLQLDSTNAAVLHELGNFYSLVDQKSKALTYYKRAVKHNANNFYYNEALASLFLELQQYTEAIDRYNFLISKNPSKLELYLYLSEAYRLDGDLPQAIAALDKLENLVGLNEKISLQKFQLYSAIDEKDKAYAEIKKYIEKYPTDVKYYILLGNLYLQENNTKEALLAYNKAKEIDPDDPYLIVAMAGYYEKTNDTDAAQKQMYSALLNRKLDIDVKLGILAQYIGTLQEKQGDTERANMLFDTLMVENPQEPKLNLMYGNLLLLQKKNDEARFQFQVYTDANPTDPFGWEQMLKSVPPDSTDESIKICTAAISYLPEEPLFYFYLGIGQYQKKDYKAALQTLKKGRSITSDDVPVLVSEFHSLMGSLYHELGQRDSAFTQFEKALRYNPQNIGVLNNYSYFLSLDNKNLDKAERMSSITIKAEPTNPTYLDTYGWIMFRQGDYVTAKIYLENAVKYSEEKEKEVSAEVLEHYGDVLFKLGDESEAVEYWIKAKERTEGKSDTLDKKINTKTYITE